jgi:hypothetical protein
MQSADAPAPYRVGQWLPSDHAFLARWLDAFTRDNASGKAIRSACFITAAPPIA